MRYAWALVTYPGDYRREHGAELLEVILAESRRPTTRETANLFVHGLRTRLGRPRSRAIVACAVLTALIAGLFGAAVGAWAGWQTTGPLPQPDHARTMLAEALPGIDFGTVDPPPSSTFTIAGRTPRWSDSPDLLFGLRGELQAATVNADAPLPDGTRPEALADDAAARLSAAGWAVPTGSRTTTYDCSGVPCNQSDTTETTRITAYRDGLALTVRILTTSDLRDALVSAQVRRTAPAGVWIGATAVGLLAAAVAFLVFAWASRRTDRPDHPARVAVAMPYSLAMLLWWGPTLTAAVRSARSQPDVPNTQLWEWLGQPTLSVLFLAGTGFAALALLLAGLPPLPALRAAADARQTVGTPSRRSPDEQLSGFNDH
jgi:hypothetical protein